jgi:hypothetical protein
MSVQAIALLGKCGLIVPALIFSPVAYLLRANSLAADSVSNVLVSLRVRLPGCFTAFGNSKATYQVDFIRPSSVLQESDGLIITSKIIYEPKPPVPAELK